MIEPISKTLKKTIYLTIIHEWPVTSSVVVWSLHEHRWHCSQLVVRQVVLDEGRPATGHHHVAGGRWRWGPSEAGATVAAARAVHDQGGERGWWDDRPLAGDQGEGGWRDGGRQVDALSSTSGVCEQLVEELK